MTLRSILSRSVRLRTCALVALACGLPLEALAQPAPAAAPAAPTDPTTAPPDDPPPAAGEDPDPGIPALPPSLVPESEMPPPTAAPAPSTPSAATPPAASAEATADDVDADASAEALAAAMAAEQAAAVVGEEPKINIYGFADFTYRQPLSDFLFGQKYSSFAVGNLNVYFGADLGDQWRSLIEVRFLYLPHGSVPTLATEQVRTDTQVPDYNDLARPLRWGGVEIERAWIERTFHPALTVRAGQWLTPYGIWNVDHGSPVIIGVARPYIIGEALFPERQTGLELYGSFYAGPTQFGYHLTLSNGRGPIDAYQDLDHNKAIGGRLFLKNDSPLGTITFGVSGYRGKYTDRTAEFVVLPDGTLENRDPITLQFDELSLAADLKLEKDGFLFQAEGIVQDTAYDDRARAADPGFTPGPPGWIPDNRRYGVYGLTGYRTPFLGIMPFFGGEYYYIGKHAFLPDAAALWGGLNARPTARVVLKAQITHSWFPTPAPGSTSPDGYNALDLQAAWSF
ncbi:MAG: hypothetical protein DIU78_000550 [Pseudomonadota bacterium]